MRRPHLGSLPQTRFPRPLLSAFPLLFGSTLLSTALLPGTASADALRADLVESKSIKLDGVPKEWTSLVKLTHTLKGNSGKPDLEAHAALAYDATTLFVAADVTDDVLRPGADHVAVVLGFPGGATHELDLFPGDPGKSPGVAKTADGTVIAGAKVVEAPKPGGYTLEASIPWSSIPPARLVRVGLRGGIFVYDADKSNAIESIVGTATATEYAALPALATEPEQALADGLLHDKGIHGAPRYNLIADVAGDAMKERILVYDHFLVVLGPTFRKGKEYYFSDLGVDAAGGMLPECEARDLTGDGQAEILLRKRFGSGPSRFREVMQVLSFGSAEVPNTLFQHEVGIATEAGSVANEVTFPSDGAKSGIRITPGAVKGFTAANYKEATETSFDPLLLPWGPVQSQTYKLANGAFAKASEEKQAVAAPAPAPAPEPAAAKAPPAPSPGEPLQKVYEQYKRDRGMSGPPRFDLVADVTGDKQVERVLLHDRDIVVFGKGFKGGLGYTYLTVSQFASSGDISSMTARDVTGDGKADIVLMGTLHGNAPRDAGGGTVDREVTLVFTLTGETLHRVFAAETARAMGRKRVWEAGAPSTSRPARPSSGPRRRTPSTRTRPRSGASSRSSCRGRGRRRTTSGPGAPSAGDRERAYSELSALRASGCERAYTGVARVRRRFVTRRPSDVRQEGGSEARTGQDSRCLVFFIDLARDSLTTCGRCAPSSKSSGTTPCTPTAR
jgi:hypothetical protein